MKLLLKFGMCGYKGPLKYIEINGLILNTGLNIAEAKINEPNVPLIVDHITSGKIPMNNPQLMYPRHNLAQFLHNLPNLYSFLFTN